MRYLSGPLLFFIMILFFGTATPVWAMPKPGGGNSNQNYFDVEATSSLHFTVSQPSHFENVQTINNAFKFKFKTKNSNCRVSAKVSNYTVPRGASTNTIPLELHHSSNNSNSVSSLVYNLHLTNYDQQLFAQKKANQTFHFSYDLNLLPLGYDYPEGQYNFTILFTMTQP